METINTDGGRSPSNLHHFPLGSGINGNSDGNAAAANASIADEHHFPLGSGINGSLISRGL